ncbi:unnamed protein product [Leptidea sinapis]|uniref:UDP-glucose 4-epimerase n=1 Tax=Leptidea sinapis TaxID=189913 RepID=A0A5E4QQN3_9NEOP|nr:unnamed protein product [Leptidea sinapis]
MYYKHPILFHNGRAIQCSNFQSLFAVFRANPNSFQVLTHLRALQWKYQARGTWAHTPWRPSWSGTTIGTTSWSIEDMTGKCVIHFAALKAVGESVEKPLEYYQANITGTCTLLEVMREHGVTQLVYSSSDIASLLQPRGGPRQRPHRGGPVRDSQQLDAVHIPDLADGHVRAIQLFQDPRFVGFQPINLGTGTGYSVLQMVAAFEAASGCKIPHRVVGRRAGDIATNYADVSLARQLLGWGASRTVIDMCRDTWKWQSENPNGYKN